MATYADFVKYAPNSKASQLVVTQLMARATRWADRATTGLTGLNALDVTDAVCAYTMHLLVKDEATASLAKAGQKIKLENRGEVTFGQTNVEDTQAVTQDWENTAWGHLFDAGVPRRAPVAGVSR